MTGLDHDRDRLARCALRTVVGSVLILAHASGVWANAGPRATSVRIIAEPVGIQGVRITREMLSIDLRPAERGQRGIVEAVYYLQNEGPEQHLDLLFAFGSEDNADWSITLDDVPITGARTENTDTPRAWWPPATTPGLDGDTLSYGPGWITVRPLAFSIVVPAGASVLKVRYHAAVRIHLARPAMVRQFAYVLAPARAWAEFGGLDVTIQLPGGWPVAVTPVLERDGDLLRGRFDAIPANAIALTMRPPVPEAYLTTKRVAWGLYPLVAIIGLIGCWVCGGALRRRDQRSRPPGASRSHPSLLRNVVYAAAIGMTFGVLMFTTGLAAAWGPDLAFPLPADERTLARAARLEEGYGPLLLFAGALLLAVAAAVIGGLFAMLAALKVARKTTIGG